MSPDIPLLCHPRQAPFRFASCSWNVFTAEGSSWEPQVQLPVTSPESPSVWSCVSAIPWLSFPWYFWKFQAISGCASLAGTPQAMPASSSPLLSVPGPFVPWLVNLVKLLCCRTSGFSLWKSGFCWEACWDCVNVSLFFRLSAYL